jgi:hypothetical protein
MVLRQMVLRQMVLRQMVNRIHRDRDSKATRVKLGRRTACDSALDDDQKALARGILALVRFVPSEEKQQPEAPQPPRMASRKRLPAQRTVYRGGPSWNHQPKRDGDGYDLASLVGSPA